MKHSLSYMFAIISLSFCFLVSSCSTEPYSLPTDSDSNAVEGEFRGGKKNDKGNGKGKNKDDDNGGNQDPEIIEYAATYEIYRAVDHDPLYRFSISTSGDLMLFQTDSTVTSWGSDYWGYWSDPYDYLNGQVEYIIGLTHTTYIFDPLPNDKFDVTKILVVTPYTGGPATTTITNPGIYTRLDP